MVTKVPREQRDELLERALKLLDQAEQLLQEAGTFRLANAVNGVGEDIFEVLEG